MGKITGFMDYTRKTSTDVPPLERMENFNEFHIWLSREEQQTQAARCMDCGVPFCQAGASFEEEQAAKAKTIADASRMAKRCFIGKSPFKHKWIVRVVYFWYIFAQFQDNAER